MHLIRDPAPSLDSLNCSSSATNINNIIFAGGPGPLAHELLWHNLKKDKPLACLECGQVFKMIPLEEYEKQNGGASVTHHHEHNHPVQKH